MSFGKIGYQRVSTNEQNCDLQENALTQYGCNRIFTDVASGSRQDRPQLKLMLDYLREGDILVIYKLDRLARSLRHLIDLVEELADRNIGFVSLSESLDTTTPHGKFTFHICGAFAELERDLIRERTAAGLKAARARGRTGGRPIKLNDSQLNHLQLIYDTGASVRDICRTFQITKATAYRYIKRLNIEAK